jgi:hypothetical protein
MDRKGDFNRRSESEYSPQRFEDDDSGGPPRLRSVLGLGCLDERTDAAM